MPKFYLCDTMGKPSTGAPSEIMGDFSAIGHDCPKCGGVASKGRTLAWLAAEAGAGGEARFPCMNCGESLVFPRDAFKPEMLEALGRHFQPNALLRATTPEEVLRPNWGALLFRANGVDLADAALKGNVVSSTAGEPSVELPGDSAGLDEIEMPDDAGGPGELETTEEIGGLEEIEMPDDAGGLVGDTGAVYSPGLDLDELAGGLEEETPRGEELAPAPEPMPLEDELEAPLYTAGPLEPETPEKLELDTGAAGAASSEDFGTFDDDLGKALADASLLDDRPDAGTSAAREPAAMHEPPGLEELTGDLEELAPPSPAPAAASGTASESGEDWLLGGDAGEIVFDDAPAPLQEPGPGSINLDEEPDVDMDFEAPRAEAGATSESDGFAFFEEEVPPVPAAASPAGWSGHGPCPACGHDAPRHQSQRLACPACAAMFWVRGETIGRESDTTMRCPCCRREFAVPASVWCRVCKQNTHGFRRVSELIREANGLPPAGAHAKPGRHSRGKRA